jgi:chaperonin cofactor prefoldin
MAKNKDKSTHSAVTQLEKRAEKLAKRARKAWKKARKARKRLARRIDAERAKPKAVA